MQRRRFLRGLTAILAVPVAARAGSPQTAHIGFIVTVEAYPRRGFDEAMRRLGWIEGQNLFVERRVTGEDPKRRATVAAALIATNPDVIVAAGTLDALAVHALTQTIPIVVISGPDLVETGLAASLAQPGGNVTGMTFLGEELDGKRLELLHDLLPSATRIAFLAHAGNPRSIPRIAAVETLAHRLGTRVAARLVNGAGELDGAFAASAADHDQAVLVQGSSLTFELRSRVVALAAQYRLPTVYERREFVESGGLLSYGEVWQESFRRAAALVDKVLKGAKPANLPIEQPTEFNLVINLKTAKALGLEIPPQILARADEVIQ